MLWIVVAAQVWLTEEGFNLPDPSGGKPQDLPGGKPYMLLIRASLPYLPASRLSPNDGIYVGLNIHLLVF